MLAVKVDRGDHRGDGGAMTFPMTFAYVEAYAAARSCLGALADISDFNDSCRYERLLIDLDCMHCGDFPATYPMSGNGPELLAHLEGEVDRMLALGGDGLSLELLLAHALGGELISSEFVEEVFVDPVNRRDRRRRRRRGRRARSEVDQRDNGCHECAGVTGPHRAGSACPYTAPMRELGTGGSTGKLEHRQGP